MLIHCSPPETAVSRIAHDILRPNPRPFYSYAQWFDEVIKRIPAIGFSEAKNRNKVENSDINLFISKGVEGGPQISHLGWLLQPSPCSLTSLRNFKR